MGVYACGRCGEVFCKKRSLHDHLNRDIPCDFLCKSCGRTLSCRSSYRDHKCEVIEYDNIEDVRKRNSSLIKQNINIENSNATIAGRDVINNITSNNNVNFNIMLEPKNTKFLTTYGMMPHDVEGEHAESVMDEIKTAIEDFIFKHRHKECTSQNKKDLLITIHMLLYSNKKYPETMNIMDDDPNSLHNKVFSGEKFVQDIMTKDVRNNRVLQIIIEKVLLLIDETLTIENTNVNKLTKSFIEMEFLPYLFALYFGVNEPYHDDMQKIWQMNHKYIKQFEKVTKKIPPCSIRMENPNDMPKNLPYDVDKYISTDRQLLALHSKYRMRTYIDLKQSMNNN